ncbi:molecular chaperone [Providencia sneebia]|uniref:Fimbrial chaperone n=1 Tax=Providencia sneebia DSM 19967 TaxID=1141660 RepID=K8WIU0_9GAMM|nr:molecular chaperone [Providencia sneebia]EKT57392.1 fimbrial chaperone [Providencia sneebia DSM 19967]
MKRILISVFFLLFSLPNLSFAEGISIGGTRFVYAENKREIDIPIFNSDKEKPFLIQSWVSAFEGDAKAPFIATPPLFRIEPNTNGSARISYIGEPLANNTEQIYLLNIKSIPPKDSNIGNELQIIINSQFKLFLRSKDIEPFDFDKVSVIKKTNGIIIDNQTPYHLSVKEIFVNGTKVKSKNFIYPFKNINVYEHNINSNDTIVVQFINDYGAIIEKKIN